MSDPTALRKRLRQGGGPLRALRERVIEYAIFGCGFISVLAIVLIFLFLFKEGVTALRMTEFKEFLYAEVEQYAFDPVTEENTVTGVEKDIVWQPSSDPPRLSLIPLIWGSLGVAILTALISTVAGVAAGLFLSEIASKKLRNFVKPMLELLVGIPTVVIGFFMLAIIALPLFRFMRGLGLDVVYTASYNMFVGALGVSIVIIPVIASLVDDALRSVPNDLRAASLSLGATRWQTSWKVVLPAGVSGVFAAIVLGFGRAMGETMIVLMCAGNSPQVVMNPFSSVRTMTASIAAEMGTAGQGTLWYHALFFVGALLVTITFVLNLVVELIVNRYRRRIRS